MLQSIRDKVTGVFAYLVLGAIAVVFVLWGINYREQGSAAYAAKVNGERISVDTARRAWQDQLANFRGQVPPEMEKSLQQATLDQLIRSKVLEQRVDNLGYRVSDTVMIDRIQSIPALQVEGKFSRERYAALLAQRGMSMAQFEEDLRNQLTLEDLQAGVVDTSFVTPVEAARRYTLEREQRQIDFVLVPASSFLATLKPTDDDLKKYYDAHQSSYMTQEKVDLEYVEVKRSDVEPQIKVTDEELKDYYEQVKGRYESQERRRARHILIAVGSGVDDAQAKKTADDLYAKVKGGADFAALAKENSKDPGSAKEGGDLGWATRGTFVGPFEDALFGMKVGEIRGPIKTQFGYHIIRLDDIEAAHTRSFEEVHTELEADYRKDKSQTLFYDLTQKLADQAFSALTELDKVAKSLNIELKKVQGFTRQGGGDLGAEKQVIDAAFSPEVLDEGRNSPMIAIGEDRAIVLRVSAHQPAEPKPLDSVKADIEEKVKQEQARVAAEKKGSDALKELKSGAAWEKVVSELAIAPSGKHSVARNDTTVPSTALAEAFKIPRDQIKADKPQFVGAMTADGNYALAAVSGVQLGDPSLEPASEKEARMRRDGQQLGSLEIATYVEGAVKAANVKKNPQAFE